MIKIQLLRHGETKGNLEKRYIGITDEALCEEGILNLSKKKYPTPDFLFSSPMLRCVTSCSILYENTKPILIPELRESDFGLFENKNYQELSGLTEYQNWINSNGTLPFPEGESNEEVRIRIRKGFNLALDITGLKNAQRKDKQKDMLLSFVIHGGSIMHILEQLAVLEEQRPFYDWITKNGCGFEAVLKIEDENAKLCNITELKGEL